MAGGKLGWRVFGTASAIIATVAVRKALDTLWRTATGTTPPKNPEHPDVTWAEAVSWAVASGVGVGIARLLATRKAAEYWRRSTGSLPPGMEEVDV